MNHPSHRCLTTRARANRWQTAALGLMLLAAAALSACVGGVGVGLGYEGGYDGPYDYDYGYDYGPWGPDYYVGPPVIVGGVVHGHPGPPGGGRAGGHPHFRPAAPSRSVPSIPSRSRPAAPARARPH